MYITKSSLKTRKKYGNQTNVYIHLHLTDGLGMEFTA